MDPFTNEYYRSSPIAEQHVHVSWRAIFAGVLVALAVELLLTLLGFAVGLTAFRPTGEIARSVGLGIGLWLIITAIASVFAGAYFGSRVAGDPWKGDGVAHGVMVWAGFSLLSLWLVGSGLGKILNTATGLAGSATSSMSAPSSGDLEEQAIQSLVGLGYSRADAEIIVMQAAPSAPSMREPEPMGRPGMQAPSDAHARKTASDVATGGAVASWVAFGIALLSLGGGALGGMLGAIGEQKQMGRFARIRELEGLPEPTSTHARPVS
jgi:hypothetical protein